MNSGAAGMGRGYWGLSHKDDNRGDHQAASARGRWYRRVTVSSHNPGRQQLPHPPHSHASGSSAPKLVQQRSVALPEGFYDIINQEKLYQLKKNLMLMVTNMINHMMEQAMVPMPLPLKNTLNAVTDL